MASPAVGELWGPAGIQAKPTDAAATAVSAGGGPHKPLEGSPPAHGQKVKVNMKIRFASNSLGGLLHLH